MSGWGIARPNPLKHLFIDIDVFFHKRLRGVKKYRNQSKFSLN